MKLVEKNNQWYWVNPTFPDSILSPIFDSDALALQWRGRVGHENFGDIEQLQHHIEEFENGFRIVLPSSTEHAQAMIRVATYYLENK